MSRAAATAYLSTSSSWLVPEPGKETRRRPRRFPALRLARRSQGATSQPAATGTQLVRG